MKIVTLLRKVVPILWRIYVAYKQYEREYNANVIRENPEDSWDKRFGDKP